jgi:hypothetical protein
VLQTLNSPPHSNFFAQYDSNLDAASGSHFFLRGNGTPSLFSFTSSFLAYKGDADHWTRCIGELMQPVVRTSSFVLGGYGPRADLVRADKL